MNVERNNHFDLLRLLAALGVIVTHSFSLLGFAEQDALYFASRGVLSFSRLGLYTFFALSGYLVCGSLLRSTSLVSFFSKRALRLFPGLVVVLLFTVFVLGPLMTTLPVGDYFSAGETWKYLLSLSLFRMQYVLPGVFNHNPYPNAVNGSLWTLAYEFSLYLILAFGFWRVRTRPAVVRSFLYCLIVGLAAIKLFASEAFLHFILPGLQLAIGHFVIFALLFFTGALLWTLPTTWVLHRTTQISAALLLFLSLVFSFTPELITLLTLPVLLIGLGYSSHLPIQRLRIPGDYSYGLYIYAFPAQQVLASFFPSGLHPYVFALIAVLCAVPFAIFSWHVIEQPALQLKQKI